MPNQKITAAITAVGGYVPETKLTNFDLEKMVDTNDEWIRTRTGVEERTRLWFGGAVFGRGEPHFSQFGDEYAVNARIRIWRVGQVSEEILRAIRG